MDFSRAERRDFLPLRGTAEKVNIGKIAQYKTESQAAPSRKGGILIAIEVIVRGRRTHDTLVEAAGELLQDSGYASVSIRAIVARAGVPKGTFYSYFSSKEALASLLVEQQLEVLFATIPVVCDRTFTAKLRQHFQVINTPTQTQPVSPMRLLVTLAAEAPGLPPAVRRQIAAGFETWSTRLSDLIFQAQEHSHIRQGQEAHHLADLLINACQGAMIRSKCDSTNESLRSFAQFTLKTLL